MDGGKEELSTHVLKKGWADSTKNKSYIFNQIIRQQLLQFIFTQNALPSEWESIEAKRVGVVCHHYSESFMLTGQFKALGDGVVKSNRLVERHVRPAVVMSLVNTTTCPQRGKG